MSLNRRRASVFVPVARPFYFKFMIRSHGWADLEPFRWRAESCALDAVIKTGGGRAFGVRITSITDNSPGQRLRAEVLAGGTLGAADRSALAAADRGALTAADRGALTAADRGALTAADRKRIKAALRWMFRLDEDFSDFQARCRRDTGLVWAAELGLGAFLRNGDLFEEFVKVLLTTNVSWAGTRSMNTKLLQHLGRPIAGGEGTGADVVWRAFPNPEDIAAAPESFLRDKVKLGYRAPFLLEFAQAVASGRIILDDFLERDRPAEALARELRGLKGFGPYAVSALLLSLGRYDRLILDSWTRKKAAERYFKSGRAADRSIERVYAAWGPWKTLACWFECAYDTWLEEELNRVRPKLNLSVWRRARAAERGRKPVSDPGALNED